MDKTIPIEDVARACAAVWLFANAPQFVPNLEKKFAVKVEHGAEGLAALYAEAQRHDTAIHAIATEWLHGHPSRQSLREKVDAAGKESGIFLAPETRDLLVNLTILLVVVADLPDGDDCAQIVSHVLFCAKHMARGMEARGWQPRDMEHNTQHALRALTTTDAPPPMVETLPPPANDSQGGTSDDTPVLTYADARRLLDLLRQAQIGARAESRRHTANADTTMLGRHRQQDEDIIASHAYGEAEGIAQAIDMLLAQVPALRIHADRLTPIELLSEAPIGRVRMDHKADARRFAWGAPSVNGFRPNVFQGEESLEVHGIIPESGGVHPAYDSAGHEVACRFSVLLERMIDQHPTATIAVARFELYSAEAPAAHPAWEPAHATRNAVPQAGERTSFGIEIACPWCGTSNPSPEPTQAPALYSGDPIDRDCTDCRQSFTLHFRRHQITLVASPK